MGEHRKYAMSSPLYLHLPWAAILVGCVSLALRGTCHWKVLWIIHDDWTLSAYLSCAIFAINGLCSSGISDRGGSCFSILDSRNIRNLTISSMDWLQSQTHVEESVILPWRVSDCFSNDTIFCFRMTFPFLSSTNGRFWFTRASISECMPLSCMAFANARNASWRRDVTRSWQQL